MDAEFQELVEKGKKTQVQVDEMIQLANEVQYSILTKGLVPGEWSDCFRFISALCLCFASIRFGVVCRTTRF